VSAVGGPPRMPAGWVWRGRRSKAGHLTCRTVQSERGNLPEGPLTSPPSGGWRERASSADAVGKGRRTRSSPSRGKPGTWRRGPAGSQQASKTRRSPVNTGVSWPSAELAEQRVLAMQTKLHRWAVGDPDRRFDDLYNLVHDPAFIVVAWTRVRSSRGARTAGVDGIAPRSVVDVVGLLDGLRSDLKARRFRPDRVREVKIPKANGKVRRLGIATCADRVVQAVLKLVLEPIFEADFKPCSYGFRPKRRAQDAIAEIHYLGTPTRNYEWVFVADIAACFDEISHSFLLRTSEVCRHFLPVLRLSMALWRGFRAWRLENV